MTRNYEPGELLAMIQLAKELAADGGFDVTPLDEPDGPTGGYIEAALVTRAPDMCKVCTTATAIITRSTIDGLTPAVRIVVHHDGTKDKTRSVSLHMNKAEVLRWLHHQGWNLAPTGPSIDKKADVADEIFALMDNGDEWDSDTTSAIAEILTRYGYELTDCADYDSDRPECEGCNSTVPDEDPDTGLSTDIIEDGECVGYRCPFCRVETRED